MAGDLHCHTRLSDGSLGIEEIIAQAARVGLGSLAITDHDTYAGTSRALVLGERYGVRIIPGLEISAFDTKRDRKVHILCFLPEKPDRLEGICRRIHQARFLAGKQMAEKVTQLFPISMEQIARHATSSKSIYKQHIMHALIEYGYAKEMFGEVYHELFDPKTGSCFEKVVYPQVEFVLDLIHSARGVAVLAHPKVYDSLDLMQELADQGKLDGVEVWHTRNTPQLTEMLQGFAQRYGLLMTGGSDFHGAYTSVPAQVGACVTPDEQLDKLYEIKAKMLGKPKTEGLE